MKPAISVIMPVYNACKYVETAINSVLNQTFKNFELIVVDDGSDDGSYNICLNLMGRDNRIKLYTKENGGICDARNFGLKCAIGEYIVFMDHDDEWENDLLEDNYTLAQQYNADLVKFGKRNIYMLKDSYRRVDLKRDFAVYNQSEIMQKNMLFRYEGVFELVWDGLYKRTIISKNGLLFDAFFKRGGEDIDFNSAYLDYISSLVVNPNIYYNHYIRYGFSTSTKSSIDIVEAALEHPTRLFAKGIIDSGNLALFCLCFAKECLAVSLKTGYHICSGDYQKFRAFIKLMYEKVESAAYYHIILDVNLMKCYKSNTLKIDMIYYIIVISLFRTKRIKLLFVLLMLKTKYIDL